jgi:hypothetical protein
MATVLSSPSNSLPPIGSYQQNHMMTHDYLVLEYKYIAFRNAPISKMCTLSLASQNHILSLLYAGYSAGHIAVSTGHSIGTV